MNTTTLGEIAQWGSGGTPKRGVAAYFGPGTPWLSIADLNDGLVFDAKESLTPAGLANSSAKVVPPGTVLVAMYGSIGKLGIAGTEICTSQAIAFAMPNTEVVDTRYFFHYLLSQRPKLQYRGRGGTQMNIGQADLKAWPIPLPSMEEQRRIAAILDRADEIRAKRRQVLDRLVALSQAIFHGMFGPGGTRVIGSEKVRIEDLVHLKSGVFLPSREQTGGVFPVYGGNGINGYHSNYLFEEPTIVIGRVGAYCGAVHLAPPRSWITDNALYVAEVTREMSVTYLRDALRVANLNLYASRSGQPLISGSRIKDVLLRVPSIIAQAEYSRHIREIERQRVVVEKVAAGEDELFASLQARAFRGEL